MLDIAFMPCHRKQTIYMFGYLFTLFSAYFKEHTTTDSKL